MHLIHTTICVISYETVMYHYNYLKVQLLSWNQLSHHDRDIKGFLSDGCDIFIMLLK